MHQRELLLLVISEYTYLRRRTRTRTIQVVLEKRNVYKERQSMHFLLLSLEPRQRKQGYHQND